MISNSMGTAKPRLDLACVRQVLLPRRVERKRQKAAKSSKKCLPPLVDACLEIKVELINGANGWCRCKQEGTTGD